MCNHTGTYSPSALATSQWLLVVKYNSPEITDFKSFSRLLLKLNLMGAKARTLKGQIQEPVIPLSTVTLNYD